MRLSNPVYKYPESGSYRAYSDRLMITSFYYYLNWGKLKQMEFNF